MNVANVWLIFSIKSLTFLPDLHPGESWFDSLTTRSPCWHCSYEFVRCGIHTESMASLLVATIPDQKTHSSRLVSSGGLLKGIQTPLRKVSCFMQFTWSVRLNSLLRTAGRPSPSSNNPPQRATHVGKTPSSTQGPFLSNNPSTRPAWIRVLARNGVSDPTPQETRVITSFQLSHRENVKLFTGSGKALLHQKHWLPFSYSTPYVKVWYKDELKSSMPISWKENPPETIATSGVYWPTRPSALLSTLARSAIAAAVVAAVLDDVTGGWGGGESLLFRRRAGRGHKRPFASTVEPQPRHRPLHSHDAADGRREETAEKTRTRKTGCLHRELCGRCNGCLHQN